VRHSGFNPAVNGLRGLSALFVFAFHIGNAGIIHWRSGSTVAMWLASVTDALRYGVEIFFMISGYVIAGSLRRHVSLRSFYWDRIVRIYVLWLPLCAAISLAGHRLGWRTYAFTGFVDWLAVTVANVLLIPPLLPIGMAHPGTWSLSYEWLFYISVGVASRAACGRGIVTKAVWSTAFVVATALILPRALFFIPGVIVYFSEDRLRRYASLLKLPWLSMAVFLFAWSMTGSNNAAPAHDIDEWMHPAQGLWAVVALLAAAHMFAAVTLRRSVSMRFLESPAWQFLGNISFSFYLISGVVMFMVKRFCYWIPGSGPHPVLILLAFACLSLLLSIVCSSLSREFLEVRLAGRLRRFMCTRGYFTHGMMPTRESTQAIVEPHLLPALPPEISGIH
jgi:peptidoglycan/LPS O-acetylase OafA/YrhL